MSNKSSGYVQPVQGQVKRLDQGIDYQGKVGDPVVAIGLARVDYVKDDPGGFGKVVYYTLLDGPARGRQIYVGHAAPLVHAGQIVQRGVAVAQLQQVSGGNAANLPGWTEIGFAKGGVPEGPQTAKSFQSLLKGASTPSAPTTTADQNPAPAAPAQPDGPVLPSPGTSTPTDTQPYTFSTQPYQPPPGSGMNSTNPFVAELWNRIASQPASSPDTQLLASNAQLMSGG